MEKQIVIDLNPKLFLNSKIITSEWCNPANITLIFNSFSPQSYKTSGGRNEQNLRQAGQSLERILENKMISLSLFLIFLKFIFNQHAEINTVVGEGHLSLFIFKWKKVSSTIWHALKKSEDWALQLSQSELQHSRREEAKKCNLVSYVNYNVKAVM